MPGLRREIRPNELDINSFSLELNKKLILNLKAENKSFIHLMQSNANEVTFFAMHRIMVAFLFFHRLSC